MGTYPLSAGRWCCERSSSRSVTALWEANFSREIRQRDGVSGPRSPGGKRYASYSEKDPWSSLLLLLVLLSLASASSYSLLRLVSTRPRVSPSASLLVALGNPIGGAVLPQTKLRGSRRRAPRFHLASVLAPGRTIHQVGLALAWRLHHGTASLPQSKARSKPAR